MSEEEAIKVEILGSHFSTLFRLVEERINIPGSIAEFGVYAGATTLQLANLGRVVWAFDTFSGIPEESYTEGLDVDGPGRFKPPASVLEMLRQHVNIRPVAGRFEDTLPTIPAYEHIIVAYVDCDLYKSTQVVLEWLAGRLMPLGAIVLDDYATHPGVQLAVKEFLGKYPRAEFDGEEVIVWNVDQSCNLVEWRLA